MPALTYYSEKLAHQGVVRVNHSNKSLILTIFGGIVSCTLGCGFRRWPG
jgi:hypothetical protein